MVPPFIGTAAISWASHPRAVALAGRRWRGLWQTSVEPRVAGHVERLLADLADAATDHILDLGCVDAAAVDQRFEREAQHLDRMPAAELTASFAEGGSPAGDDHRVVRAVAAATVVHDCLSTGLWHLNDRERRALRVRQHREATLRDVHRGRQD